MGRYDVDYYKAVLKESQDMCYEGAPNIKSSHRKAFVEACEVFHNGFKAAKNASAKEQQTIAKDQQSAMKKCVKCANKIFDKVELGGDEVLEACMLKGAIIMYATPEGLAEFASASKKHGKLIDHLLASPTLMKEMLMYGGAKDGKFGQAMKIYTKILASFPEEEDELTEVNRKIAMAVALELCVPMTEFDTKIEVDPVERYKHYEEAYKNGELDEAFPHFSIWELRHVINSDATNDQLKWGRDMMINYAPYITTITDLTRRYLYILETDVLMRNPNWTDSPRTYQQVLSGGGKDAPNAWFGRFICKAHGIPTWGCKQPGRHGLTRWTAEGWKAVSGANWDTCAWEGVSGIDFKAEIEARSAHDPEEFYAKLVMLECFSEVMDGRRGPIPDDEKTILHPHRVWRSLAIIRKALMLEPAAPEAFERSGDGGVKTRMQKYLEIYEKDDPDDEIPFDDGKITVHVGGKGYTDGNCMLIASNRGGKQLNFMGPATVEYDLPDEIEPGTYDLVVDVCTVHLKQPPMTLRIDHGDEIPIPIPYTIGEWQKTEPVKITLNGGDNLRFARPKNALGIAIKKFELTK